MFIIIIDEKINVIKFIVLNQSVYKLLMIYINVKMNEIKILIYLYIIKF